MHQPFTESNVQAGPATAPSPLHIDGGQARCVFEPGSLQIGDTIEIYAGDDLIAHGVVDAPVNGALNGHARMLTASVPLQHAPVIEFPTELRTISARSGAEVALALHLARPADLLRAAGSPRVRATLSGLRPDVVRFDLDVETLPEYPREMRLRIDGHDIAHALSQPAAHDGHPARLLHEIAFSLPAPMRDGMRIEIVDMATGTVVHEAAAGWIDMMPPVLAELQRLQARYDKLAADFARAQARLDASANLSRDRQILERLDMFYFLLNERLDREVKWLADRIDPVAAPESARAVVAAPNPTTQRLSVHDVSGIGFYEVETDGRECWRWFGPQVTLMLRDVDTAAHMLSLEFNGVATGVDLGQVSGSVNGLPLVPELKKGDDGRSELCIALAPSTLRADRSLIVNLSFGQAFTPSGDTRALSAVFTGARLVRV